MINISRSQAQLAKLGALLQTATGRMKMAAALGPSLRRRRDYQSIARKALMVEVLPDGALPIYDKEFDETGQSFVEAFVVGEEGGDLPASLGVVADQMERMYNLKKKIRGDADPACVAMASVFTPVPGGVGPIAVAMIFRNLLDLLER